jgi:hypothetical protein
LRCDLGNCSIFGALAILGRKFYSLAGSHCGDCPGGRNSSRGIRSSGDATEIKANCDGDLFITIYVLVAIVAVIAILQFNVIGFIFVLLMSATHFGIGDAAFINEMDRRGGRKPSPTSS